MKALQIHAHGDTHVTEIPALIPKATEAIVEVEWCGICGSDLHEYKSGPLVLTYNLIPKNEWKPMTLGHEIAKRIKTAPPDSGLKPGDKVVVNPAMFDGDCASYLNHGESACAQIGSIGLGGAKGGGDGGLAEFVAVEAKKCDKIPD
jgi:threonine dehydrogenase-like Zn-dependent dehydrogenase